MQGELEQDGRRVVRTATGRTARVLRGVAAIGSVFVISGPSGAGKGTLIRFVLDSLDGLAVSVSATTRAPRPGEVDGLHYRFLSRARFDEAIAAGEFLESVEYGGSLYGTLRSDVQERLADGYDVILEIELRGARAVRAAMPAAALIFIAPPSMAELADRLRGRATESDEAIARRLAIAEAEVAAAGEFDAIVINDVAERAAAEVVAFIRKRRKGD